MKAKSIIQIVAGAISLLALLTYTFWHTGGLLARYIAPGWLGYVAAGGIEGAVVVLSIQIGTMRQKRQDPAWFVAVLVALVFVSALANVAEGYSARYSADLTLATVGAVDVLQGVFGLAATALISLIVFSLAEIVGQDVNAILTTEPTSTATAPATDDKDEDSTTSAASSPWSLSYDQLKLLDWYAAHARGRQEDAANFVGKSRAWVGQQLTALERDGVIHRNGNGIEIIREIVADGHRAS